MPSPGTRAASGSAREICFSLPIWPIQAPSASLLSSPQDEPLFQSPHSLTDRQRDL